MAGQRYSDFEPQVSGRYIGLVYKDHVNWGLQCFTLHFDSCLDTSRVVI